MFFNVFRLITDWIFYNAWQIYQKQVKNSFRVKSDSQRSIADSFVLTTSLLRFTVNNFSELVHVVIMFTFLIDKFCVLLFALDLTELNFDGSSGYDAFAFWEELLSDDTFEERAFTWMRVKLPVDCDPTTAIMGRLTSRLTSERRMIYWDEWKSYLDLRNDGDEFLHEIFAVLKVFIISFTITLLMLMLIYKR